MAKIAHGTVELYDNEHRPTGTMREYKGIIVRDFEDGSYLVLENDKELLIETYFNDTINITNEEVNEL